MTPAILMVPLMGGALFVVVIYVLAYLAAFFCTALIFSIKGLIWIFKEVWWLVRRARRKLATRVR